MRGRQWLIAVWGFTLVCASLCGCSAFIDPGEPVATWMPLPTRVLTNAPSPTITPTSTATPKPPTATVDVTASETPQATAIPAPTSGRVAGWRGRVRSLPDGSAFDDYFRRLGERGEQYGIEGADAAVAEELAQWRDSERIVKVWGVLQRDVEDYGDARIRVERFEVEALAPSPVPGSELVKGWLGTVRALPSQALYDDYFHAQSPRGQYGIASDVDRLAQELIRYRDTGTVIRIWGVLEYGVSDYGEKRIMVTRIQVVEP